MNEIPRTNADVRKELAREARDLRDNLAFKAATKLLRDQWTSEFMNGSDVEKVMQARAKLQVLEGFEQMLGHLMTSEQVAQQRQRGFYG